jgi:hypothetical protein
MPGPQLIPANFTWLENSDTVRVFRRTQNGETFTDTTIYAGPGDFEIRGGGQYYDAVGAVDQADAQLILDPVSGNLLDVHEDDLVTISDPAVTGVFVVVQLIPYNFPIKHLEVLLKHGPIGYEGVKR